MNQLSKLAMGKVSYGKPVDWFDYDFYSFGEGKSYELLYMVRIIHSLWPYQISDWQMRPFYFPNLAAVKYFMDHMKSHWRIYDGYQFGSLQGVQVTWSYPVVKTGKHIPSWTEMEL